MKTPLVLSVNKAFKVGELITSQKHALIKLIEKNGKEKRLIKNGRPTSLLNVDRKLVSKVLAEVSNLLKLKGLLRAVHIEKTLHSVNHNFLLQALENYGFSQDFLKWISS